MLVFPITFPLPPLAVVNELTVALKPPKSKVPVPALGSPITKLLPAGIAVFDPSARVPDFTNVPPL